MTLKELEPLSNTEKEMVSRLNNEEEAVMAILKRRTFLRENSEYTASLMKEQYKGRYAPHNEKETATMRILYEEDN
jgi:hypothetical protein